MNNNLKPVRLIIIAIWALLISCGNTIAAEKIEALSFYESPPYLTDPVSNAGLAADFAAYLNMALSEKYQIHLQFLPRTQVDKMMRRGDKACVLFIPSFIYNGVDNGPYLWTAPLFKDRQELISRKNHPFEFNGPASLFGVHFGAMLGHTFPQLTKDIAAGKIKVERNSSGLQSLINMLLASHLDVVTMPESSIRLMMVEDPSLSDKLWFSKQSLSEYTRHVMFQQGMEVERNDVDLVMRKMNSDPVWLAILKKYGLQPISNH
ncbi:transporter substrate-binding domain-containing protein [Solimicrobium silvestre]|uniref:Bacterial extracellular solute-binding protein, family 3 n=1 Tax=Solimicrobium silvestre TaxID=2099400 RepID=A0A2S9H5A7_9BURK|nr:transporter substrate-binding domain-containing protein [Solimicrobium silvestre]PRC95121.1 Bacterial extracellular solute-binding protein, family 3 [Solimicrobium silvestre]